MKRFHWFEISLVAIIMLIHLYAAFSAPHNFSMQWFIRDDAYYYFKVAQNITEGHGSSFDGINLSNGYHPLWLLICIPVFFLARFDLILPLRVLMVLMAVLSCITSVLLFRLARKALPEPIAMLVAAFWGLSLIIHGIVTQPGMETGITALSIVAILYLLQKFEEKWRVAAITNRDMVVLGLGAAFILFSRLDSVYLALIVGVWVVLRGTPMRYLLLIDLLLSFLAVVYAYIQRAELKYYLLTYTDMAIVSAVVFFTLQTVVFYFLGLYHNPKVLSIKKIIFQTFIGVLGSTLLASLILWVVSTATSLADLPRGIPLVYGAIALCSTLLTRLLLRGISPWSIGPDNAPSPLSQLRQSWKVWLREGAVFYGLLGGLLGAYMLFNHWMFGTFMPVSGQIKRWWGTLPNNVYGGGAKTILDVFAIDPHSQAWKLFTIFVRNWALEIEIPKRFGGFDTVYWGMILIIVLVVVLLILRKRKKNLPRIFQLGLIPLLIGAEFQAFGYGAMGYAASHEWYWSMQMIGLVLLAGLILANLFELLPRHRISTAVVWVVAGAACLALAFTFVTNIYQRMSYQDRWVGKPYMGMLPILEVHTEPGSIIGMTGGGNAGYFIGGGRVVVNMDGLINSYPYFQAIKAEKAADYLEKMGLKYVFGNYYILTESMPYRYNLSGRLQQIPTVPTYGNKELLRLLPAP